MPPRSQALPEAATESAREARKSFFCNTLQSDTQSDDENECTEVKTGELCQKGYARMNEFEAHEKSYDHQHRRRLKDLRQATKDPNAASRARLAEERANEEAGLRAISSSTSLTALGQEAKQAKKKPRFKSTLQPHNKAAMASKAQEETTTTLASEGTSNSDFKDVLAALGDEELLEPNANSQSYLQDPANAGWAAGWANQAYDPSKPTTNRDIEFVNGRIRLK